MNLATGVDIARSIRFQVDGDLPFGVDLVEKFAVSGTQLEDGRLRSDLALEELVAEDAPDPAPVL